MALFAVLMLAGLGALGFAFWHWTASDGWSFPHGLLLTAVVICLPGHLLLLILRVSAAPLDRLALMLAVGMSVSGVVYWLCTYWRVPHLFRAWPLVLLLVWAHPRYRPRRPQASRLCVRYAHSLLLATLGSTLVPLFVSPLYFQNLSRRPDGQWAIYPLADVIARVAIAAELTHTIPPQNPYLPGRPLPYHSYGMDLVTAMFGCFGLAIPDLTVRYVPVLFLTLAVLGGFCLGRRCLQSESLAALLAFLVVLGEDLSFVPGLALGSREPWAVHFLGVPSTVSLYLLNPMLPALALLLVALLCIERFLDSERRSWLVVAALVSAALVTFKIFVAAQLLGALCAAGIVHALLFRRATVLMAGAAIGLATVPLLLALSLGTSRVNVAIDPWPYVPAAVLRMGLSDSRLGQLIMDFYRGDHGFLGALAFCGLGLPVYLALTFGARIFGIAKWADSLARPSAANPLWLVMALIVFAGPPLSMLLAISPAGYPARLYVNNAGWFFVLSKYLMWFFAVEPIRRLRRFAAFAGGAGLIVLGVPSTVQFLSLQGADRPQVLDRPTVEMLSFLDREVRPGELCLAREEVAQAILVTTRCRSLTLAVFPYTSLSPGELEALTRYSEQFWQNWQMGIFRQATLGTSAVDLVVVQRLRDGALPAWPDHTTGLTLDRLFLNEAFVVFRVRGGGRQ